LQGVILAAGMATRLKPLTDETPKCLLKLDEQPILYYMIRNLKKNNIEDIIVVTGFQNGKIENYLLENFPELNFQFIHNADYETTNNAYSLLLAEKAIKKDFLLLDSDIVFHPDIISTLLSFPHKPVLAVNRHACGEEEIKVIVDGQNRIHEISKQVEIAQTWGESIGIEFFDRESKETLFRTLQKRIIKENRVNEFYEASFQEMIQEGQDFYAVDTSMYPAMEIDFAEDLEQARKLVKKMEVFSETA
jgi:choline kinase